MSVKISALTELDEAPASGDLLFVVDTSASASKKATFSELTTGYITAITSYSIEDLSDVSSMTPSDGDILQYSGSAWTSALPPDGSITMTADGAITAGDRVALTSAGKVKTITTPNANSADYFGIARDSAADTATLNVFVYPSFATNQTGLTPGQHYFVNSDGTLTTTDTGTRAGKAVSSTTLLIKPN